VLRTVRGRLADNLALLRAFFARHQDTFAWHEPKAGTVCFPRLLKQLPGPPPPDLLPPGATAASAAATAAAAVAAAAAASAGRVDVAAYCAWLVETHSILLLPATVYDGADDLPCFRLGFGRADFPAVLHRWEQTLL
jgi:aspartate/methionine/tyrosine aminotransferase